MSLQPGSGRFDPNMEPHDHVVCDACGAVRDLPPAAPTARRSGERAAARRLVAGFALRSVEQIFRGLCASLRADGGGRPEDPQGGLDTRTTD